MSSMHFNLAEYEDGRRTDDKPGYFNLVEAEQRSMDANPDRTNPYLEDTTMEARMPENPTTMYHIGTEELTLASDIITQIRSAFPGEHTFRYWKVSYENTVTPQPNINNEPEQPLGYASSCIVKFRMRLLDTVTSEHDIQHYLNLTVQTSHPLAFELEWTQDSREPGLQFMNHVTWRVYEALKGLIGIDGLTGVAT
jgi:hypothetical protein